MQKSGKHKNLKIEPEQRGKSWIFRFHNVSRCSTFDTFITDDRIDSLTSDLWQLKYGDDQTWLHTMHRRGEVAWVLQKTQTGSRSVALLSCILFILKIDPWTLHFPEFGRNLLEKYFKPSKYDTRQEEHWHCWLVFNNLDINVYRFHNIWWKREHSPCWKHTIKRSAPSLHFAGAS